jgi:hypothetical protein
MARLRHVLILLCVGVFSSTFYQAGAMQQNPSLVLSQKDIEQRVQVAILALDTLLEDDFQGISGILNNLIIDPANPATPISHASKKGISKELRKRCIYTKFYANRVFDFCDDL